MKTQYKVLSFVLALALVSPYTLLAADGDVAYHEKLAASYEEKALAQDGLISEHQQMKADFAKRVATSPKAGTPYAVKEMDEHCNAIIKEAQGLKAEYLDFAKWHQMRAAELQGR